MKVGDLVKMKTHDTGLVGIVVDTYPRIAERATPTERAHPQIGIKWFKGSGKVDWEPEAWLEVVSESG
jgi:hypothetical protein